MANFYEAPEVIIENINVSEDILNSSPGAGVGIDFQDDGGLN